MSDALNPHHPAGSRPVGWGRDGLCLCLLLFAAAGTEALATEALVATNQRLGTLFYSPSERDAIVRARLGLLEEETPSAIVHLTGIVKRSGGKSTAWINGQAVPEGQSEAPGVKTTISTSSVTVDGQRVRVGEAVDINTHQRVDIVSPGAVTTKDRP